MAEITGTDGADKLTGVAGEGNSIDGLSGNDTLIGAGKGDGIVGGSGKDYIRAGKGGDLINGNEGSDTIFAGEGDDFILGRQGDDDIYAQGGNDVVSSAENGFNDVKNIVLGRGDDIVNAGRGKDLIDGGAGQDLVAYLSADVGVTVDLRLDAGGSGVTGDTYRRVENVYGSHWFDNIVGSSASNVLKGFESDDRLMGGRGTDDLDGGSGDDTIVGGSGEDTLTGGEDADRFVFKATGESNRASGRDLILDFDSGEGDRIGLAVIDANRTAEGNQAFSFIGTGKFTGEAGELRYRQLDGDTVVSGDVTGDKVADFVIFLDGPLALTVGDFVL